MNEKIKKFLKKIGLCLAFVFIGLAGFFAGTKQRHSDDKRKRAESIGDELEALGEHQRISAERLREGIESVDRIRSRETESGRIIRECQDIIAGIRERAEKGTD